MYFSIEYAQALDQSFVVLLCATNGVVTQAGCLVVGEMTQLGIANSHLNVEGLVLVQQYTSHDTSKWLATCHRVALGPREELQSNLVQQELCFPTSGQILDFS